MILQRFKIGDIIVLKNQDEHFLATLLILNNLSCFNKEQNYLCFVSSSAMKTVLVNDISIFSPERLKLNKIIFERLNFSNDV